MICHFLYQICLLGDSSILWRLFIAIPCVLCDRALFTSGYVQYFTEVVAVKQCTKSDFISAVPSLLGHTKSCSLIIECFGLFLKLDRCSQPLSSTKHLLNVVVDSWNPCCVVMREELHCVLS